MRGLTLGASLGSLDTLTPCTVQLGRPGSGWTQLEQLTGRARETTEQMQREGIQVRFLRSIFVPEDDACYFLYEGHSAADVQEAVWRADLELNQLTEAMKGQEERK